MTKHLKRLAVPRSWTINKKSSKYVTRPHPTRSFDMSIPINIVIRDILKIAKTTKEVKGIISHSYVFVNGKRITDYKQVMGFMDVLEIKGQELSFRMLMDTNGKLYLHPIKGEENKIRLAKIIGKTMLKKAKMQLNFEDGTNLLVEKTSDFKTGDTLVLEINGNKISDRIPLAEKCYAYMIGGSHTGISGVVSKIEGDKITIIVAGKELKTAKRHAFMVGRDAPLIHIGDK